MRPFLLAAASTTSPCRRLSTLMRCSSSSSLRIRISLLWSSVTVPVNKDFVGETLDRPVGERLLGTLAATAVCAWHGARIFRVHEVSETRQVVDMTWAIAGRQPPRRPIRGLG